MERSLPVATSQPSCSKKIPNKISNKEYPHSSVASTSSINGPQKIIVFSNWRVKLNKNYDLIIKGTLEGGRLAHGKPIIKRYSATCVGCNRGKMYHLQGNIVDKRHVLPDYVRGKFHKGFPDDWKKVYQIWRKYVNQRYPVTYSWPNLINSDDDLSELTKSAGETDKFKIIDDKLKVINKNWANRNYPPEYYNRVIEMLDCLISLASYRASLESNEDSAFRISGMSSKSDMCLQSSLSCDDNRMNTNKLENNITKRKSSMHSDLRLKRIKNNSTYFPPLTVKSKKDDNNDSNELESETYVSVPKITKIEQLPHDKKVRKKPTKFTRFKSAHGTIPIANNNGKNLLRSESGINITKDKMTDTAQRSLRDALHPEIQRDNLNAYDTNKRPAVQTEQPLNVFEARGVNSNVKEQKVSHEIEEDAHSQFIDAGIDYNGNFDNIATVSSANTQKRDENVVALNLDQDVINSESNNFPLVLRKELLEQPKNEIKKFQSGTISSVPLNLNLKIKKVNDSNLEELKLPAGIERFCLTCEIQKMNEKHDIPAVNENQTNVIETIQSSNKSAKTEIANNAKKKALRSLIRRIFLETDSSEEEEKKVPSSKQTVHT